MFTYRSATFSEIIPIWQKLWPNYEFKESSDMVFLGGYDINISKKYQPFFIAAETDKKIVATFSGHFTSQSHFRGRGLFVEREFRGQGVATQLVHNVLAEAAKQNASLFWVTPRFESWPLFKNLGFQRRSPFTLDGFKFGPNCYASIYL